MCNFAGGKLGEIGLLACIDRGIAVDRYNEELRDEEGGDPPLFIFRCWDLGALESIER
jgi:hypothetical protein